MSDMDTRIWIAEVYTAYSLIQVKCSGDDAFKQELSYLLISQLVLSTEAQFILQQAVEGKYSGTLWDSTSPSWEQSFMETEAVF